MVRQTTYKMEWWKKHILIPKINFPAVQTLPFTHPTLNKYNVNCNQLISAIDKTVLTQEKCLQKKGAVIFHCLLFLAYLPLQNNSIYTWNYITNLWVQVSEEPIQNTTTMQELGSENFIVGKTTDTKVEL